MVQIGLAALWATAIMLFSIAAAARGRWPERAGAAAAMISWLVSLFIVQKFQVWDGPHLDLLAADLFLFISLSLIGIFSSRLWPLVAGGFQLCGVGLDFAYLVQPHVWNAAYYIGIEITSWMVLLAMTAGLVLAWRHTG